MITFDINNQNSGREEHQGDKRIYFLQLYYCDRSQNLGYLSRLYFSTSKSMEFYNQISITGEDV